MIVIVIGPHIFCGSTRISIGTEIIIFIHGGATGDAIGIPTNFDFVNSSSNEYKNGHAIKNYRLPFKSILFACRAFLIVNCRLQRLKFS